MNDLSLYCFMGLAVFAVIALVLRSAGQYKSYYAAPEVIAKAREASKPNRSPRAQEVWNRLNPKVLLDDDETEVLPNKKLGKRIEQR
jgi:hypothetical protein